MNGAKQISNDGRYAVQTKRIEGFLVLTLLNTATALTTDTSIYFQKLWIYPGATATGGKINANAGNVNVGNTAQKVASVTLTTLQVAANTSENQPLLVTAAAAGHGFNTGDTVRISGASDSAYNNTFQVTKVDANNFTFTLADPPLNPTPTGTIVAAGLQTVTTNVLPDVLQPADLPLKYELPLGQKQPLSSVLVQGAINDGVFYRIW